MSEEVKRPPERPPLSQGSGLRQIRGRRSARLAADRRRRRTRRRWLALLGVVAVVAVAAAVVVLPRLGGEVEAPVDEQAGPVPGEDGYTLLLALHGGDGRAAHGLTLLAGGAADGPSLVLFLPVGTLVDIPGVGTDRLGLAYQYGGAALLQASVENLLGIGVDHVALVSDSGLGAFLDRLGGLRVEVPSRLLVRRADGSAQVRFEPGEQYLDGARLAEYWTFRARGEDELASFPRQQRVLDSLFDTVTDDDVVAELVGDGAPQLDSAADAGWLGEMLRRLARAREADALRFALLPVEPFGGDAPDGGATYRLRTQALDELTTGVIASTVPGDGTAPVRIQVLNGVGVPGVGQQVDGRLDRGRFRIVVTDNARNFDFTQTQILVYDESEASLEAARRVRDQLGVGTIQVSRQPQSVVDLTIVVGADFLSAVDAADEDSS